MPSTYGFEQYFDEIKLIWEKLNNPNRIIPFCTPLIMNPKFLVIGTNHSNNFDRKSETENNKIADLFSNRIPTEVHTFLDHQHPFAEGLKGVVGEIQREYKNFKITREWIGTNRCAIQTDSGGLGEIPEHEEYQNCEKKMDALLKDFICFSKPENVILTGMHACRLFYTDKRLQDMTCKKMPLSKDTKETFNLIPIWHLSELWRQNKNDSESFREKTIKRLKQAIEEGFCEY